MTFKPYQYRVVEHPNGFEPQQLFRAPITMQDVWQPLNVDGYWVQPEAYSRGEVTRRMIFNDRADAERAIVRAKAVNEEHIQEVPVGTGGAP